MNAEHTNIATSNTPITVSNDKTSLIGGTSLLAAILAMLCLVIATNKTIDRVALAVEVMAVSILVIATITTIIHERMDGIEREIDRQNQALRRDLGLPTKTDEATNASPDERVRLANRQPDHCV